MPLSVEQFLSLFAAHQRELYRYIVAMVPTSADADDVFQETALAIWRHLDEFEPGTNFAAWATTIAHYRVLAYRRSAGRDRHVFSPELLARLADRRHAMTDDLDRRRIALDDCLTRLTPEQRQLVDQRYGGQKTVREIAVESDRPVKALYKMLERIRRSLADCIERKLAEPES